MQNDLIEINIGNGNTPKIQSKSRSQEEVITYKDLDKKYLEGVIENVNNFYDLFNDLIHELDFRGEFGLSNKSIELFNQIKSNDQLDYLMQGVKGLSDDSIPEEPVAQSLFFFPLTGLLYDLASSINQ